MEVSRRTTIATRLRAGRIVGALLILQLAAGLIVPYVLLRPLTIAPTAFLEAAAPMAVTVRASVLMLLIGGLVSFAIAATVWPVVRDAHPTLGLWLLAFAVLNVGLQFVENAHWLTMLSVSEAFTASAAPAREGFPAIAIAVRSAWRWAHYSHIFVVVGWLFLLFLVLFRSALVPRGLTLLGMALAMLHCSGITLPAFAGYRVPNPTLFGMPLGLGILSLAAWLLARGFRSVEES